MRRNDRRTAPGSIKGKVRLSIIDESTTMSCGSAAKASSTACIGGMLLQPKKVKNFHLLEKARRMTRVDITPRRRRRTIPLCLGLRSVVNAPRQPSSPFSLLSSLTRVVYNSPPSVLYPSAIFAVRDGYADRYYFLSLASLFAQLIIAIYNRRLVFENGTGQVLVSLTQNANSVVCLFEESAHTSFRLPVSRF